VDAPDPLFGVGLEHLGHPRQYSGETIASSSTKVTRSVVRRSRPKLRWVEAPVRSLAT
jgi:hypothetical protein